ncbi:putative membrane protein YfcA [Roseomonas alkaliterrae]|uniref:Probable membrane transporter protein n=1 Tax=Neoroseomonas alkaliterrae TaxID=1452450 RepID=A0A840XQX2_9PROT|nr:putative membrane protein YfcA [Neoroseomonas alkaliterrae]
MDGAIGIAHGLTATSAPLFQGAPPVVASAGAHAAEVATAGLSGLAHWPLGHVLPRVMLRLALAGALGGVAGAMLAVHLPMAVLRPLVSAYLLLMGMLVLRRAWRSVSVPVSGPGLPDVRPLGFGGGAWTRRAAAAGGGRS